MYYLFNGVVASSPQYWLLILLVPVAALAPDFFVRQLHRCVRVPPAKGRKGGLGGAGGYTAHDTTVNL